MRIAYKIPESVLVVVYSADGQFLLLERAANPGYWQSVTGSREAGETLEQTALRELAEETGIHLREIRQVSEIEGSLPARILVNHRYSTEYEILPLWRDRYPPGVVTNTEHWFSCKLPEPAPVRLAPGEHRAQGWFTSAEARERCFSPSNQRLIEQIVCREFVIKLS